MDRMNKTPDEMTWEEYKLDLCYKDLLDRTARHEEVKLMLWYAFIFMLGVTTILISIFYLVKLL